MTINALGLIPIKTDSCPVMWNNAKKKKMTVKKGSEKIGDLVLYDFNHNGTPDHIGIVVSVSKSYIWAVEGNTGSGNDTNGGQVQRRKRTNPNILGYVRPKYTKTITAQMVVATALAELGVKESPKNSNKVKYNQWFYGKNVSAFWCCTFICWLFAHVIEVVKVAKPTGIHSITIPNKLVKRGSKGDHVKKVQTFLNWYHPAWKLTVDGDCGKKTQIAIMSYQLTEGLTVDGEFGSKSLERANTYKAKKKADPPKTTTPAPTKSTPAKTTTTAPAKKGYSGKFPTANTNVKILNGLAYRYCWPYGTKSSKYKYKGGKPLSAYTKALDEAYPGHKKWKSNRQSKGACCDVYVGAALWHVGVKVKKDLKNQLVDMPKMTTKLKSNGHKKAGDFKMGDVVQRGRKDKSGHTWIVFEDIHGKKYVSNAHYKHLKGCYACMDAKPKTIVPSKWKYYKCYTVQGAVRTDYRKGDYGYDVLYIQKFLNWYGIKCSNDGDFGPKLETAVKTYQKKRGLTVTGKVDSKMISDMKAVRK